MADIFHYFPINASIDKVFDMISTPVGIDKWWAKSSMGEPDLGALFNFNFGPNYNWTAVVSKHIPMCEFELTMQEAEPDWQGSLVGFRLTDKINFTEVQFYHTGWKEDNEHFRISTYCWAMYLRLLKRNVEFGEFVAYEERLNV